MKDIRIVALVPMRHESERVPGKNYRNFAGRPLFHHIIKTLLKCNRIAEVVIDTDSSVIMEDSRRNFPEIRLLERPPHLRDGTIPMNEVLLNIISQISADFYLQTHCTNPLLTPESVTLAIEKFLEYYPMYDSLFSVTRMQTRLWDSMTRAINHNPAILARTQDLPPVYRESSTLYIFPGKTIELHRNRLGLRPFMFEINPIEAMDIDEEIDFRLTEFLFLDRLKSGGNI